MSIIDSDRYNFDKRLRELQEAVTTLNHRVEPEHIPVSHPSKQPPIQQYVPQYQQQINTQIPMTIPMPNMYPPQNYFYQQDSDEYEDDEDDSPPQPSINDPKQQQVTLPALKPPLPPQEPLQSQPEDPSQLLLQAQAHRKYIQDLELQDQQKEQQLLGYLDSQNKMIQSIAERLEKEKLQEERYQKKLEKERLRKLEMEQLKKEIFRRQDILIKNLQNDFYDYVQQATNPQGIQNPLAGSNDLFFNYQSPQSQDYSQFSPPYPQYPPMGPYPSPYSPYPYQQNYAPPPPPFLGAYPPPMGQQPIKKVDSQYTSYGSRDQSQALSRQQTMIRRDSQRQGTLGPTRRDSQLKQTGMFTLQQSQHQLQRQQTQRTNVDDLLQDLQK